MNIISEEKTLSSSHLKSELGLFVAAVFLQSLSHNWLVVTPLIEACQAPLSYTISQSLLKFKSFESVMLTLSSSASPFSICLQSFPASGFFVFFFLFFFSPISQFFASGGQSTWVSASASVLPMCIQGSFPLGLTGLILQSKGFSTVFSSSTVQKHQFFEFFDA